MGMTATAHRVGSTLTHEVDVNGRHLIITDEPEALGGADQGPAPHELLAATLASCISTMVAMYAKRHSWDIGALAVHVDYDPDVTPRRFAVELVLPSDLSGDQLQRLQRVAQTCPVRRALEAGFQFDERVIHAPRLSRNAA